MVKFQAVADTKHGLFSSLSWFQSLLNRCKETRCLPNTKQLHANVVTSGLLSSATSDTPLQTNLAAAYALCGYVPYARRLFEDFPLRSSFLCNAVMRMYMDHRLPRDALRVFVKMLGPGNCRPDNFTYPIAVKACSELSLTDMGFSIHGRLIMAGYDSDTFVQNSLLAFYMNSGETEAAQRVFDEMSERTVVSWNTMITGYFKNARAVQAMMVFMSMLNEGMEPDSVTAVSVLPACGCLKELEMGRKVHAIVEEKGLGKNIAVSNALVDMYAKCGSMNEAQSVLEKMDRRDVVTWTTMINGHALSVDAGRALNFCRLMQLDGVKPNAITISSLLSASGRLFILRHGRCLHGWSLRQNFESDVLVETALIDMYAKCKRMDLSLGAFRRTMKKRTEPWNALISGYTHNNLAKEAIKTFKEMMKEQLQRSSVTLNSLLPAYAVLADLQLATNIHGHLAKTLLISNVEVITCLVDIYSKSGGLKSAHKLFNGIPLKDKDIILWSVIIGGYGMHGHGRTAVQLFTDMVQSGVKPNEVTFTSVLHACSHAGLVEEGLSLFRYMLRVHPGRAQPDHYTCIVDLLGRAGRLNEAYNLIRTMPYRPNHAVWGALLGSCVIHENVDLGEVAAENLFELEPENTGNYVLLAKIYSATGRWKDAENVRCMMNQVGLIKTPAHSVI